MTSIINLGHLPAAVIRAEDSRVEIKFTTTGDGVMALSCDFLSLEIGRDIAIELSNFRNSQGKHVGEFLLEQFGQSVEGLIAKELHESHP